MSAVAAAFLIIGIILVFQAPGVFLVMLIGIVGGIYAVFLKLRQWWREFNGTSKDPGNNG